MSSPETKIILVTFADGSTEEIPMVNNDLTGGVLIIDTPSKVLAFAPGYWVKVSMRK